MEDPLLFRSLLEAPTRTVAVVSISTMFLICTSGIPVNLALARTDINPPSDDTADTGTVIGKLENVLVVLLVLVGAYTALSIVVAGKSIVRQDDMDTNDSSYYLMGTLTKFVYSLAFGMVTDVALRACL